MSKRILCYGDSNTWGYDPENQPENEIYNARYPSDVRWTGILKEKLGEGYTIIEEGLNGRTTVWDDPMKPYRNGLMYIDACIESHEPLDMVIIMLGTNDLKPRISGRAFDIAEGVGRIVERLQVNPRGREGKVPEILLVSPIAVDEEIAILPFAEELGGINAHKESLKLSQFMEEKAKVMHCHYMDAAQYAVPKVDGVHLDAENHAKLAEAFAKKIKEIL